MNYITPHWTAPNRIKAFSTTRHLKQDPASGYDCFNLAEHVGDDQSQIEQNRHVLCQDLSLPQPPTWLNQTHSHTAIKLTRAHSYTEAPTADASYTFEPQVVCAVLTADCLPVLVFDRASNAIAAIHGGWRGLLTGIIPNTLRAMTQTPHTLTAWLGPAISGAYYEVGDDVYQQFLTQNKAYSAAFVKVSNKWLLDINKIATIQLRSLGVHQIDQSKLCTYSQPHLFYSFRRDGKKSGRMATLIWNSPE